MTLVDLPGLTYESGLGPFIENIYTKYIKKENAIILYVTPAVVDSTTGHAMSLIDKEDEGWQRTMGIITKIDSRSENFQHNFKMVNKGLGAFCVRNRTHKEVLAEMGYDEALEMERRVLVDEDFTEIPTEQKGVPALIEALVLHQREMIVNFKPKLRKKLASQKVQSQANLNALPKCYGTYSEKNEIFLKMLQKFSFTTNDIVKNCRVSL